LTSTGLLLAAVPALPLLFPDSARWFLAHFFPSDATMEMRRIWLGLVVADAARGGLVVGAAGLVAALAATGRLRAPLAAAGVVALVAADLLRTGAGLNPTVTRDFFEPSPETSRWAEATLGSGRVFTCDVGQSRSYRALRMALPGGHETWSFAVLADSLTPLFNMKARIPSALSPDLTMLVPVDRVSSPAEATCRDLASLLPRLRRAGVGHVLSLDPLQDPDLTPGGNIEPRRVAPAVIHTYALRDATPLVEIAGGTVSGFRERPGDVQFEGQTLESTVATVNVTPHAGWTVRMDGQITATVPGPDGRLTVPMPPGHHHVALGFRPPALSAGLLLSVLSGLLVCLLPALRRGQRTPTNQTP
jgi:hypothetical protein